MLTDTEKKIIDLMKAKRQQRSSAYDEIIFSDNEAKQRTMLQELKSQSIYSDVNNSMAEYYGSEAVKLIKTLPEAAELIEGMFYELDYKKGRKVFKYQGRDMGRNYFFVSDNACYRIAENQIKSVNAKPI